MVQAAHEHPGLDRDAVDHLGADLDPLVGSSAVRAIPGRTREIGEHAAILAHASIIWSRVPHGIGSPPQLGGGVGRSSPQL